MISKAVVVPLTSLPAPTLRRVLADGTYEALVFDADGHPDGGVAVELTILAGEHKGEVISIVATAWTGDALDLLGIPATVTVADGQPSVRFEP